MIRRIATHVYYELNGIRDTGNAVEHLEQSMGAMVLAGFIGGVLATGMLWLGVNVMS